MAAAGGGGSCGAAPAQGVAEGMLRGGFGRLGVLLCTDLSCLQVWLSMIHLPMALCV